MRNRRVQRNYQHQQRMSKAVQSADVPFPFNLCGVGLLFGDGTMEDDAILTSIEKKKLKQSKLLVEREDEEKRKFRMRKKESQHMEEGIEVVESFDATQAAESRAGDTQASRGSRRSFRK